MKMRPTIWREVKNTYGAPRMEEHVARKNGFTLRVRGPRGGSSWRWTIERVAKETGAHHEVDTGHCVELSVAKGGCVFRAERLVPA